MDEAAELHDQLLATKFFIPSSPHTTFLRSRLFTLLTKSLEYPLTLVSAPAGFGKTTLLSNWLYSLPSEGPKIVWLSVDEADNEPVLFWRYVLTALDRVQPGLCAELVAYLYTQQSPPVRSVFCRKESSIMTLQEQSKPTIGLIGMGHMGSHMALRLINAGYQLTVYDRTREKAQAIAGASVASSPKEAATESSVVISMVTDDAALEEVMFGPNGVLTGTYAGSVLIDMSTVSPRASRHLFQGARAKGVAMIDAAVSGSVLQAEQGSLVIFVGGERETYQQCQPILDTLGQSSFYMGPSGMGTTMKLVVNTLLGLGMQALAEALALGEKAGLSQEVLLDVLGQTSVLTVGQKAKLANVRSGQYPTQFALSLQHKDLRLILSEADEVSVPMPATAVALQMYTAALTKEGDADFSILIEFMKSLADVSDRVG